MKSPLIIVTKLIITILVISLGVIFNDKGQIAEIVCAGAVVGTWCWPTPSND